MIAIIDYGVGNLYSLASSLTYLGLENQITCYSEDLQRADRLILPGVGAFGDAAQKLRDTGLVDVIKEQCGAGKPLLGICLGMQMLFERSYEYGVHAGLSLIPGYVADLTPDIAAGLKVPHIGWNSLDLLQPADPFFRYVKPGDSVYYVHSFYAKGCEESLLAVSDYSIPVPGVVKHGSVYGCQFHPEKSGNVGLGLLKAFAEL